MRSQITNPKSQIPRSKSIKALILTLFITFNFVFAIWSFTCAQDASPKEEEALFVAQKAFEDGFYEVSLGLLERFLKNYPDSPKAKEVELLIGRVFYNQSKYLDALSKFEGLLKDQKAKDIRDAVLYWIAEVHFKGNSFNTAAGFYKKIIEEFPNSRYTAISNYSLGWCLFQEQEYSQALEYFKTVEEKYPKESQSKDASFKIIECLYNLKSYSLLKEKAKSLLKANSKDPVTLSYLYFYIAEADYYLNNYSDAVENYLQVLKNSNEAKIKELSSLGVGWSQLKLKHYKEAEEAFSEIKPEGLERKSQDVLLLGKAALAVETNKAEEAKAIYNELLKATQDPFVMVQAYLGKGDCLYNLGEYAEALKLYKAAQEKAVSGAMPQEVADKIHHNLAWAYLKQGEFKEALNEFQKIVKESQDKIIKVSALCQIGDTYQDSGNYPKALETYDTILNEYPDSFYSDYVQYQMGVTFLKSSNYDAAILSFQTLKKNFPGSKLLDDASYALGLAYFQRQDYASSKELFEKFQEDFKDSNLRAQALYLLGASFFNLGRFSEAVEVFKNIIRGYVQDTELVQKAEYEIADCYYQMGNEKEAMSRFNALRSKYPDSSLTAEIVWWLGGYYYRKSELGLAKRYLLSLIRDFPKSSLVADSYYALGSIYEDENSHEEAVANFKKVLEMERADLGGQAAIAIAGIYAKQEKPDLALSSYKEIAVKYPNLSNIVYPKMADLFFQERNYQEALSLYHKSLDIVPAMEAAGIQMKVAEVLQAQGKVKEAIEEYLKVTYLYSEDKGFATKALLRVAEVYETNEDFKEALKFYDKVIKLGTKEAKYAQERIDWIKENIK